MEKRTEKKSQILASLMYKAIVRYSKQKTLKFQSESKCKFVLDFCQQQSANTDKEFTIRKILNYNEPKLAIYKSL